ncbi:FAD-dependent oxidoreductase [Acidiferrimicrobium sp. IK]|uniref:oxidoreductase n=1 Tax=Acidiferrimicrobium sp. IK TaxID=2871700 RepID=UPI0021CB4680|nr:FAD-dependent oxidoreductase [Acidiferrimicrobium sp. IK]MCU4186728.1 FAD-dependent oxidoreductase [Acidiferrimicrobium sp. IK]
MNPSRFSHLLAPGRLGPLQLRNRVVLPAMDQNACSDEGLITDEVVAHYEERARGGVGLLILETSAVAYPVGATSRHQPSLSSDDCIPGLRRLGEAVHAHGAKMIVQMCHHGKVARVDTMEGREQLVASVPLPEFQAELENVLPDELAGLLAANGSQIPTARAATSEDLDWVVGAFAAAARRVQAAGLDGVEVHGGHGYLIASFLSPYSNRRGDEYGGSSDNRARLLTRVVRAVREACGPEFAVVVRLDGQEHGGGITPELAAAHGALAAGAGADAVHVSSYSQNPLTYAFTEGPLPWRPGQYIELARQVKAAVEVPVIAVGRISPALAEELLSGGDVCDFVAMGRQLLADPEIPNRLAAGRPELIRTCINCFVCVAENFWDGRPVCAVNARLGHYDRPVPAATGGRRVVVVGGGPAGLEAARVAAGRGHEVLVMESRRLGGTALLSSLTTPANGELVRYLVAATRDAGVEVRLGRPADADDVAAEHPDVVVVATGARRVRPAVPGGDLPHVLSGDDLRDLLIGSGTPPGVGRGMGWLLGAARAARLLEDPARLRRLSRLWMPIGRRVAVVGGGLVGVELAEFLAERRRTVTVLEDSAYLGAEMALPRRMRALHELAGAGVRTERNAAVTRIDRTTVTFESGGDEQSVPADTVIYAAGVRPDPTLADALRAAGLETVAAGDCATVGYIQGAIRSGADAAARI